MVSLFFLFNLGTTVCTICPVSATKRREQNQAFIKARLAQINRGLRAIKHEFDEKMPFFWWCANLQLVARVFFVCLKKTPFKKTFSLYFLKKNYIFTVFFNEGFWTFEKKKRTGNPQNTNWDQSLDIEIFKSRIIVVRKWSPRSGTVSNPPGGTASTL